MKSLFTTLLTLFIISSCASFDAGTYNVAYKDLSKKEKDVKRTYDQFEEFTSFTTYETRVFPDMTKSNELKEKYDMNKEPSIKWMPHQIYMSANSICEGKVKQCNKPTFIINFDSYSQTGWKLLDYSKIIILYDDNRYTNENPKVNRSTLSGSNVLETISISPTFKVAKDIANSDSVQARIGTYELNISYQKRSNLRKLLEESSADK